MFPQFDLHLAILQPTALDKLPFGSLLLVPYQLAPLALALLAASSFLDASSHLEEALAFRLPYQGTQDEVDEASFQEAAYTFAHNLAKTMVEGPLDKRLLLYVLR